VIVGHMVWLWTMRNRESVVKMNCYPLTHGMQSDIMHTMNETNRNPVIRVYARTRQKLKVQAAQHNMTMQDYVEWLANEQERREKGEKKDDQKL
jgi:hypothetical protein